MSSYDNYQNNSFRRRLLEILTDIEESTRSTEENTDSPNANPDDDTRAGTPNNDLETLKTLKAIRAGIDKIDVNLKEALLASSEDKIEREGRLTDVAGNIGDRILPNNNDNNSPSDDNQQDSDFDNEDESERNKREAEKSLSNMIKKFSKGLGNAIDDISGHLKSAFLESTTDNIEREGKIPEIAEWIVTKTKGLTGKFLDKIISKKKKRNGSSDDPDDENDSTTTDEENSDDVVIPADESEQLPSDENSDEEGSDDTQQPRRMKRKKHRNTGRGKRKGRVSGNVDRMMNALVEPVVEAADCACEERKPTHRPCESEDPKEKSRVLKETLRSTESLSLAKKSFETFKSMRDGITGLLTLTRVTAAAAMLKWIIIIGLVGAAAAVLTKLAMDLAEFLGMNKKEEAKDNEVRNNAPTVMTEDGELFDKENMKNESLNEKTSAQNFSAGFQEADTNFTPELKDFAMGPFGLINKYASEIAKGSREGIKEVGQNNYDIGNDTPLERQKEIISNFADSDRNGSAGEQLSYWFDKAFNLGGETGKDIYSDIDENESLSDEEKKTQRILRFLQKEKLGVRDFDENGVKLTGQGVNGVVNLSNEELSKVTNVSQDELATHLKSAKDLYESELKIRDAARKSNQQNEPSQQNNINAPTNINNKTNISTVRRDPNPAPKEHRSL